MMTSSVVRVSEGWKSGSLKDGCRRSSIGFAEVMGYHQLLLARLFPVHQVGWLRTRCYYDHEVRQGNLDGAVVRTPSRGDDHAGSARTIAVT